VAKRNEVEVYADRPDLVSIDVIKAGMSARGMPVTWTPAPFMERLGPTAWKAGEFSSEAAPGVMVGIGRETATAQMLKDVIESKITTLDPALRDRVSRAQIYYGLGAEGGSESDAQRLVVNLADVIAEAGDGVIRDYDDGRVVDRASYRAAHPELSAGGR
jgi:hypothetical protein